MPNRELNTQMRQIVYVDGVWLRCRQCPADGNAYWGAFRTDEFVAAKWNKHAEKAHDEAGKAARIVRQNAKALRAPQNPAPKAQPDTGDVLAAVQDPEALLDQAIRDLNIGLKEAA